jgi:hypothetical protein
LLVNLLIVFSGKYPFMRDYSFESATERIEDHRTKEYFNEVISSYYNENYRAAVVLLYTITICDLVFKLQNLRDIYGDSKALNILKSIEQMQKDKPYSAEWEVKLIELIEKQTNLLEPADVSNITQLQKHRHLCAHPVLVHNYELYNPNKETVRAHLRNILEGILTKPPLFSRSIFDDFIKDLSEIKEITLTDNQLENFLTKRYFDKFTPIVETQIVKSLWKVTLKLDNDEANPNREINFKALVMLIDISLPAVVESITKEPNSFGVNVDFIDYVVNLLNEFPEIYDVLSHSDKVLIDAKIDSDRNLKAKGFFRTDSIEDHLNYLINENYSLDTITMEYIEAVARDHGLDKLMNHLLIKSFGVSGNFYTADARFDNFVLPMLERLDPDELKFLLHEIDSNNQIYNRRKAGNTNRQVKEQCDKVLGSLFDYSAYPHFVQSI